MDVSLNLPVYSAGTGCSAGMAREKAYDYIMRKKKYSHAHWAIPSEML